MVSLSNQEPPFDRLKTSVALQPTDASTSAACLSHARHQLRQARVDAPWLEALILLEHATGYAREALLAHPEHQLPQNALARYDALVTRRCAREPLAYIVGYREFYGRPFALTAATLIPRPETEGLVEIALAYMARRHTPAAPRLLDVGTGSGAIAVTLLAERPPWSAVATDVEIGALAVAQRNARAAGVEHRLQLVACSLANAIDTRFPLVVANLPYVPTETIDTLEPEIARFEPRGALDGGADGTAILAAFLRSLSTVLEPSGAAVLEIGEGQADALAALARASVAGCATRVANDAAGVQRFLVVERP